MKFFLELVSCCGCQESGRGRGVGPDEMEEPRMDEETRYLVASVRRNYRRKRRGRVGGGGGGGRPSADWEPSLCVILEDNVEVEKEKSEAAERVVKRKSGVSHKARGRVRSYSHEFRGSMPMPTVIPAFSPTPFMF